MHVHPYTVQMELGLDYCPRDSLVNSHNPLSHPSISEVAMEGEGKKDEVSFVPLLSLPLALVFAQ